MIFSGSTAFLFRRFQTEVQHPGPHRSEGVARTEMRAGCCTKITIRSRMETVSVPSESTLRYAVGDFKPQLIVARKSLPLRAGRSGQPTFFFFTVCPLRAGRSVGEAAAAAGPARGLARRRRRPPQLTRKNLPGGSRRHRKISDIDAPLPVRGPGTNWPLKSPASAWKRPPP